MQASDYVGRVGGLAIALGIGLGLGLVTGGGLGVAAASPTDSSVSDDGSDAGAGRSPARVPAAVKTSDAGARVPISNESVIASASVASAAKVSAPLSGSGLGGPIESPLAWAVLASTRGQVVRVRVIASPSAAVAAGSKPTGKPVTNGTTIAAGVGQGIGKGGPTTPASGPTTPASGPTTGGTTTPASGPTTTGGTTTPASGPTTTGGTTTPASPAGPAVNTSAYAPGEVLIGWAPGASAFGRAQAMAMIQAKVLGKLGTQAMLKADQGVYRLQVPGGTEAAIKALANNPAVAFVEPNYKVTSGAIAQDSYYTSGALWGMQSDDSPSAYGPAGTTNQYGTGAEEAWGLGYTGSRNVVVAVLDEGMQITHPDLVGNIWVNPGEVAGDGVDNDANGFVDDVNGWDFYYDDKTVYDAGEDAHGTHVAGTIGALGGNSTGVAGVNWNVTIIPTKFLGPQGGYISDAVDAMNYLTDLKSRYNIDLVAVNNSWGGGGYSSAMHGAILRAAKADILFVAAAGNSTADNDTTGSYPSNYSSLQASATESAASYESVIAVASITSTGSLSSFSSYGATTVDLGAPGSGIWSTVPTNSYASYNGTSMATPHVTGALALYASYNTGANAAGLRSAILGNTKATTSLAGKTVTGGRLSLEGMFGGSTEQPPTPPPPVVSTVDPTVVSVSAPLTTRFNRNNNVVITVGNLGNTAAQVNVALTATGGTPGNPTTVLVPAGGSATAVVGWKAPRVRTVYTLTATTTLASVTLTDANLSNNTGLTTITVV